LSPTGTMAYSFHITAGQIQWFTLPPSFTADKQVFLIQTKLSQSNLITSENFHSVYLNAMPKDISGLSNPVSVRVLSVKAGPKGDAVIVLASAGLALFVVLTTRAAGRFSENCFTMVPGESKVRLHGSISKSNSNYYLLALAASHGNVLIAMCNRRCDSNPSMDQKLTKALSAGPSE
jgi:hypothetical protein